MRKNVLFVLLLSSGLFLQASDHTAASTPKKSEASSQTDGIPFDQQLEELKKKLLIDQETFIKDLKKRLLANENDFVAAQPLPAAVSKKDCRNNKKTPLTHRHEKKIKNQKIEHANKKLRSLFEKVGFDPLLDEHRLGGSVVSKLSKIYKKLLNLESQAKYNMTEIDIRQAENDFLVQDLIASIAEDKEGADKLDPKTPEEATRRDLTQRMLAPIIAAPAQTPDSLRDSLRINLLLYRTDFYRR